MSGRRDTSPRAGNRGKIGWFAIAGTTVAIVDSLRVPGAGLIRLTPAMLVDFNRRQLPVGFRAAVFRSPVNSVLQALQGLV
jgi:hypothetical protein